jgi:cellulose 1,4-beta-cellobiosidase
MTLALQNQTDTAFDLSTVTIRYWMSSEPAPQMRVDYSSAGLKVAGAPAFVPNSANSYIEFSFGAGGTVPPYVDQNSLNNSQIQAVVSTNINNAMFNQANDWSFDRTATQSKPNPKMTVYDGDTLIWGCEPSHLCATPDPTGAGGQGTL